jgi:hypothetical protein
VTDPDDEIECPGCDALIDDVAVTTQHWTAAP